jgi:acyl-ACP thioesterase
VSHPEPLVPLPLVPLPPVGRVFRRSRRVRLGDVTPAGRLRLDALARYLQDVSNDDTTDARLADDMSWVVRRTVVEITSFPAFAETVELATFCGGTGGRWAERRVSVTGDDGGAVEASTLWVHLDLQTLRPKVLPQQFLDLFGEAAQGRKVSARLLHDDPSVALVGTGQPWPLRFADFDLLGHVNNAAYWAIVEEQLARRRDLRAPMRAELEFHQQVEPGADVRVVVHDDEDGSVRWWLVGNGDPAVVHASAVLVPLTGT